MKMLIAGVTREIENDYARRLMEQGAAVPAPPVPPAIPAPRAKGKKAKDVTQSEPENKD